MVSKKETSLIHSKDKYYNNQAIFNQHPDRKQNTGRDSREAADGLNQDKVRCFFTVWKSLPALSHVQRLFHDGVSFLFLHFHIVDWHITANDTQHSTEVRQWCERIELLRMHDTEFLRYNKINNLPSSWNGGIKKWGGFTISRTSAWCPSSDRAAPQRSSPSARGL